MTAQVGQGHRRLDRAISALLVLIMGGELLWLASDIVLFDHAAMAGVVAVTLLTVPRFGLRETYLLTLCIALTVGAFMLSPEPGVIVRRGLDQAAFLVAFILLVGLIQQAARSADAVRDCGLYLTQQPAGRRYFVLFIGVSVMVQLFNLGLVSLIAPLIKRGGEGRGDDPLQPLRERRQITAMLRGFGWAVVWSPTAVAPLVLLTLLPAAERGPWMAAGGGIAFLMMMLGWAEDRFTFRTVRPALVQAAPRAAPRFPRRAFIQFSLVCLALLTLALAAMTAFDESVVFGLMAASPVILVGWLLQQNGGLTRPAVAATRARVAEITRDFLPFSAPLAVSLGCSGFVGRAAAALIPTEQWTALWDIAAMPGWLFMLGLSCGVALLSQFALSPIMMAVFFGSLVADIPVLPVDVTWAALAISCGWALSTTISPFATVVLMTGQITGHSGRVMTWFWNGRFTALCVGVLGVVYWLLTGGT